MRRGVVARLAGQRSSVGVAGSQASFALPIGMQLLGRSQVCGRLQRVRGVFFRSVGRDSAILSRITWQAMLTILCALLVLDAPPPFLLASPRVSASSSPLPYPFSQIVSRMAAPPPYSTAPHACLAWQRAFAEVLFGKMRTTGNDVVIKVRPRSLRRVPTRLRGDVLRPGSLAWCARGGCARQRLR